MIRHRHLWRARLTALATAIWGLLILVLTALWWPIVLLLAAPGIVLWMWLLADEKRDEADDL